MPDYEFSLRDDELDLEVPLIAVTDEPLDFELDEEPSAWQLNRLLELASEGHLEVPEVTDACLVLQDFIAGHIESGLTEWDDAMAQRIGRLIGIASYFDAGVNVMRQLLGEMVSAADWEAGEMEDDIETRIQEAIEMGLQPIRKDIATLAAASEEILNLQEAIRRLRTNEHDIRPHLNNLGHNAYDAAKLNGHRSGRIWKFHEDEVARFSKILYATPAPPSDPRRE